MPKKVRAVIIGLAVGFVTALVLSLAQSALNLGDAFHPVWAGVFVGIFAAYILGNLAGNRATARADDATRNAALTFRPAPGSGALYIYREGFVAKAAGLNVRLDDREVVQLKSPRFTCLPVTPGAHRVSFGFGGLAGAQSKTAEANIDVPVDGVAVLRVTMSMGAMKNAIKIEPESDLGALKIKLGKMPMTLPDGPKNA